MVSVSLLVFIVLVAEIREKMMELLQEHSTLYNQKRGS